MILASHILDHTLAPPETEKASIIVLLCLSCKYLIHTHVYIKEEWLFWHEILWPIQTWKGIAETLVQKYLRKSFFPLQFDLSFPSLLSS